MKTKIDRVKEAASGDWEILLVRFGGCDADLLDGKHHPCPKCGGKDRFRYFNDGTGGSICNQCFNSGNADGIATLAWLRGESVSQTLALLADHYGIQAGKKGKKMKGRKGDSFGITWTEWNEGIARLWCMKNSPITVDALKAFGARMGQHQGLPVIAIPIYGQTLSSSDVVGYVLFHATGGKLPTGKRGDELVGKKTAPGSKSGLVGPIERLRDKSSLHVWKCEGITDALSLHPHLPDGHVVVTNAAGCKERPKEWMCRAVKDKIVYVVHDCDVPGQEGATYVKQSDGSERPGWAPSLAIHAKETRNVVLPFPVQPDHGKDLRDWLKDGNEFAELSDLALGCELVKPPPGGEEALRSENAGSEVFYADDDPIILAKAVISHFEKNGEKLVMWNGEWYIWEGKAYRKVSKSWLESSIYSVVSNEFELAWLKRAASQEEEDSVVRPCKKVTCTVIRNVTGAVVYQSIIDDDIQFGSWIDSKSGRHEKRNILSMQNGLLDIDRLISLMAEKQDSISVDEIMSCLMPHSPNWFSPVVLPYKFAVKCCHTWTQVVKQNLGGDEDAMRLLQQWCGYCLIHSTQLQKFMIFEGDGGNGKSVILAGMEAIMGSQNVSSVSLEGFSSRFEKVLTLGKLANITHDAGEMDRRSVDKLKSFTSGDPVIFDRKNKDPVVVVPTARLTIACNNLPNWGDKSDGIWRRILHILFNQKISPDKRIIGMDNPSWWLESGELPGMLWWSIRGLYDLMVICGGKFHTSQTMTDRIEEYRTEINTARAYLTEEVVAWSDGKIECTDLYRRYSEWCKERGNHPQAIQSFGRELKRLFPGSEKTRARISGDRKYVYKGVGLRPNQDDF